ncbi:hypothetical protein BDV11DRAFT_197346 [Aspergillus similis]
MKVLYVNYDGGAVGQSVTTTYTQMKGPKFPTVYQHTQEEYPTEQDIQEEASAKAATGELYILARVPSRV